MRIIRSWLQLTAAFALVGALAACDEDEGGTGPETLDPPSSLSVSEGDDGVQLSWSAVSGASSYDIERKAGEGSFSELETGVTGTSFIDEDVEAGQTYEYQVRAVSGSDRSLPSAAAQITVEGGQTGGNVVELSGDISDVRELSADSVYILEGRVRVLEDAELHIPAGTLIQGDANVAPTFLVIERGGKIFAEGTAEDPIVFTSSRAAGERQRGDWGGVVINGRAQCNLAADNECVSEGGGGFFGGNDNEDDSGVLRYVRIEFVGYEVSPGNELNGLTLNGVGSGTTIEYVQVHQGLDDGIEWFGGTVNVKYAIITGASDDSFDYSSGWQGKGQFWVAVQDPDDADQGFEIDNNETDNDAEPRVNPGVFNVTLVGKGPSGGTAGESTQGILYRRGAWGTLRNFIAIGFEVGLDIDNTATFAGCASGDFTLASAIFSENAAFLNDDEDDETECTDLESWSIADADPQLPAAYVWPNLAELDLVPPEGSPALSDATTPPADDFFEDVDYIGGVAPTGTPWYQGWIETSVN